MDRNRDLTVEQIASLIWSLSARRAWIEIRSIGLVINNARRRSPQGERG